MRSLNGCTLLLPARRPWSIFTHSYSLQSGLAETERSADTRCSMARTLLLALPTATALTLAVAVLAATPSDGTLAVKRASGTITISLNGTVLGRVNGRVA